MIKHKNEEKVYSKDVVLVMAASFFFMFSNMYCNPLNNGYAQELGTSSAFAGVIVGMMSFYGIMNTLAMAFAPAVSINLYRAIGYREAIIISALSAPQWVAGRL